MPILKLTLKPSAKIPTQITESFGKRQQGLLESSSKAQLVDSCNYCWKSFPCIRSFPVCSSLPHPDASFKRNILGRDQWVVDILAASHWEHIPSLFTQSLPILPLGDAEIDLFKKYIILFRQLFQEALLTSPKLMFEQTSKEIVQYSDRDQYNFL